MISLSFPLLFKIQPNNLRKDYFTPDQPSGIIAKSVTMILPLHNTVLEMFIYYQNEVSKWAIMLVKKEAQYCFTETNWKFSFD